MKKHFALLGILLLNACASTSNQPIVSHSQIGKISAKETIVSDTRRSSPIDVGVGFGGGGNFGWGVSLGLEQLLNLGRGVTTSYVYRVAINNNEMLTVQSERQFNVNDCVNVLSETGRNRAPVLVESQDCSGANTNPAIFK
jgi:hypothetical protein